MFSIIGILDFSKMMIDQYQDINKVAIDMTLGRGNDSLYLQDKFKKVYAFDIQLEAIENAKQRLDLNKVEIIYDNHQNVDLYVEENVKLVIYNLGFLINGDQSISTNHSSTINSLNKVISLVEKKGLVIIVVYPGHENGKKESLYLDEYIKNLNPSDFVISKYLMINMNNSPYIICIHKK